MRLDQWQTAGNEYEAQSSMIVSEMNLNRLPWVRAKMSLADQPRNKFVSHS